MKHKIFTTIMTIALILAMTPAVMVSTDEYVDAAVTSPDNVKAKATKKATIIVDWDGVSGAESYSIFRATKKDGNYKCLKTLKKTKYTDKKINPKKRYYYTIRANMPEGQLTVSNCNSEVVSAKLKIKKSFKVKAYAYTGGGSTKIGKKAKVGRIAVDPRVIKLGSWLYVEGYGVCQECDIGGNIKGKTIDVYKNTKKQVNKWGVKRPRVYIIG